MIGMPHKLETQGAGDRRRFDQFDRHRIAEPMGLPSCRQRRGSLR